MKRAEWTPWRRAFVFSMWAAIRFFEVPREFISLGDDCIPVMIPAFGLRAIARRFLPDRRIGAQRLTSRRALRQAPRRSPIPRSGHTLRSKPIGCAGVVW